jgi:hypothetical protein
VVRRILVPQKLEEAGECRKLYNEDFHNLSSSPNIIRMIKSMRIRWAGHVVRMGEGKR